MVELQCQIFDFDNERYEIKLFRTDLGFNVISYKDGQRVNPFTYSLNDINSQDYNIYYGEKAYERFIQIAKDDIANGLIFGKKLTK